MENKIIVKIDLSKINKNKIEDKSYKNEAGFEVKQKMYSLELVPTMAKTIKETDTYKLVKRYFVAEAQTKEERQAKTKTPILGDGLIFENKTEKVEQKDDSIDYSQDEVGEIPFKSPQE